MPESRGTGITRNVLVPGLRRDDYVRRDDGGGDVRGRCPWQLEIRGYPSFLSGFSLKNSDTKSPS